MRYFKIYGGTQFCGCDFEEYVAFKDTVTVHEIMDLGEEMAYENAASFEEIEQDYDIDRDDYDTYEEFEQAINEARECYYSEASFDWDEVTKEEWEINKGVIAY